MVDSRQLRRERIDARTVLINERKRRQRATAHPHTEYKNNSQLDDSKPREEYDFKDFYPDLDENSPLDIMISEAGEFNQGEFPKVSNKYKMTLRKPSFNQIPKEILPNDNCKIPRNIIKLGYKENTISKVQETYIKENDLYFRREQNNAFFQTISHNQLNFKSGYDMDEQDNYYLKFLNQTRDKPLTHELFEIAITILENEWFYLEKKIPPKIRKNFQDPSNLSLKTSTAMAHTALYGSDDGIGFSPLEEQHCAICDESECDNSNAIIFCDGCDIAVHQDCYGVIFIPEGQWLCRRCMISKKRKIRCIFCPSTTGAFKQTENGSWCHVLCGLWIPELYFASAGHMEPIEGFNAIPKGRWKLNCYICKQKVGACIQCANKSCFTAFHPTCAKRAGLFMNMSKGVQGAVLDKSTMHAYCHRHSPQGYNVENDVKNGIEKTRLFYNTVDLQSKIKLKIHKSKEQGPKNAKVWKTLRGTPIPPNYFIKVLVSFFKKLKIPQEDELSQSLVKYWCMKREMKRGASLIRRIDSTSSSNGNYEEIKPKIEFCQILLKDMSNLQDISKDVVRREAVMLELQKVKSELINYSYFPNRDIITKILAKIFKIDSSRFLLDINIASLNLSQIEEKNSKNYYFSINEFRADIENLFSEVEKLDNLGLTKVTHRISREIEDDLKTLQESSFNIEQDFILDGLNIKIQPWKGPKAMEEVGLSDVE